MLGSLARRPEERLAPVTIGNIDDWLNFVTQFTFGASTYTTTGTEGGFETAVQAVHRRHGVVAGAVAARSSLMSQVSPVWRNTDRNSDEYGRLTSSPTLSVFDAQNTAGNLTTSHLFGQAETHIAYAGNAYLAVGPDGLELWRPDLVDMLWGTDVDTDDPNMVVATGDLIGYAYFGHGRKHPVTRNAAPGEVAHFAPEPDPTDPYRGEAWVTAVFRELRVLGKASDHLDSFFENAAVPRTIIRPDKSLDATQLGEFQELFDSKYKGAEQAYRTWFIGGGSDVTVVGSKLSDLDLRHLTGGLETAVTMRSRVPASVLGTREGMQGSALNAGNYTAQRRQWGDTWFSPHADGFCRTIAKLVAPPRTPSVLTYDPELVFFLQEDRKDAAEISQARMAAVRQGVDAGFDPDAVVDAVNNDSLVKLRGAHTGLTSVQLLPPGTTETQAIPAAAVRDLIEAGWTWPPRQLTTGDEGTDTT